MPHVKMKNKTWIVHILLLTLQLSLHVCGSTYNANSKNLFNALTNGYNVNIRPDSNVPVSVSFTASSVNDLDIGTGQLSVTGWFSVSWIDSVFTWDPSSYGNVNYLFLTKEYCWRPQLAIDNSVDELKILNDDTQQMRVDEHGIVLWEPGGVFTVLCDVDGTYFPYDKQTCYLSLSSAVYDNMEVTLSHYSTTIKTDNIINNAEWKVFDTSTETENQLDGRNEHSKTLLRFTFKLERNSSFYVWTLLLPYFMLSCLGLVVFILPPTKGEKSSFSLTIIFLVVIFFIIFSTLTPISKGKFPAVGIYFILLLIVNILELMVTVLVERLNRNDKEERPVSAKLQRIVYVLFARISCYRKGSPEAHAEFSESPLYPRRFSMPKNTRVSPSSLPQIKSSASMTPPPRPRNGHQVFDRINSAQSTRTTSDVSTDVSNASSTLPLQMTIPEYSWKDIACMVDRISLVIFFVLVLLLTSIFIVIFYL
ncbi:acetylcholine receptor subunit alpha-like 1 [Mercenaria mercenaria]|uniref:acetylcholine receptor subunit alpha-like 1 n=1 Tax=Mercenaria mercenaria TaxID=6596 RepID=UPI00234F2467|nr:acetylcholine receptor subunit alpha-like 1 [Mercenaria mercenaria]